MKENRSKYSELEHKSSSKLYKIYSQMKARCYNTNAHNYEWYGAKGVTICESWLVKDGYISFYKWAISNGYKEGLTIDRLDSSKEYSNSNCQWITQSENSKRMVTKHNKRNRTKCIETGVVFDSGYDASKWLLSIGKTNPKALAGAASNIKSQTLKGKSAYGYTWEIMEDE